MLLSLLVNLLLVILVLALIWYVIRQLVPLTPEQERIVRVIFVVVFVLVLVWFLLALLGHAPLMIVV